MALYGQLTFCLEGIKTMEYIDGYDLATLVETCDVEMKKAAGRDGKGAISDSVCASYSAMANTGRSGIADG